MVSDRQPDSAPDETSDGSTNNEDHSGGQYDAPPLSRRGALASLIGLGGLGLGSRRAQARHGGQHWRQAVDAGGNELFNLGALSMRANSTDITDFAGDNLTIDSGVLHAAGGSITISDDGTDVQTETNTIDFTGASEVTTDGAGDVVVNEVWTVSDGDALLTPDGTSTTISGIDLDGDITTTTLTASTDDSADGVTAVDGRATADSGQTTGLRGESTSPDGRGVYGANLSTGSGTQRGVRGEVSDTDSRAVEGLNTSDSGSDAYGVWGESQSDDGKGVVGFVNNPDSTDESYAIWGFNSGDGYAGYFTQDVYVGGDFQVVGAKSFAHPVETADGAKEIRYKAREAPVSQTEVTDVGRLVDGRAEIDLPEHFALVTSQQAPLKVQTTPHSADSDGLAVTERSPERIVVEDRSGSGSYEFTYTVTGVRDGHEDEAVVVDRSP